MSHFRMKNFLAIVALAAITGLAHAGQQGNSNGDWPNDANDNGHDDHQHDHDHDHDHGDHGDHHKPTPGPVQYVSEAEFQQMVDSGALQPATGRELREQELHAYWADVKNRRIIEEFKRQNPDIPGFDQLVELTPADPAVHRTIDGNYRTLVTFKNGFSQTIETNGQSTKLAQIADSIVASTDPVRQLGLYQAAYSQYSDLYTRLCTAPPNTGISFVGHFPIDCANLVLPSALTNPSELQNVTLVEIHRALTTISALGVTALHSIPLVTGNGPVPCNEQVGASSTTGVNSFSGFGDQTQSAGYTTPSTSGIVGNFNFVNKNRLSCIKNQGQRGTCHIFAATSALEELIARDTNVMVNLSEQDFMERLKLFWAPAYFNDGGDSGFDIQQAAAQGYQFAYENQWDYNPSLLQPRAPAYEYQETCANYPYPSLEPSCSDSAPQGLQFCTELAFFGQLCGYAAAPVQGASPYTAVDATNIWNPANKDLSVGYIFLALAFNSAVPMCFNETNNFQNGSPGGYIEYSDSDNATSAGGHCVHIVGYVGNADLAANANTATATPGSGGGYFIVKNSWGASFGDAGYLYMPVDYVKANATTVYSVSSVNH